MKYYTIDFTGAVDLSDFYQRIIKLPLVRHIFNKLGSLANYIVENQDKRIVNTQLPKKSGLSIGEKLIAGDFPIVQYRKIREQLQNREIL